MSCDMLGNSSQVVVVGNRRFEVPLSVLIPMDRAAAAGKFVAGFGLGHHKNSLANLALGLLSRQLVRQNILVAAFVTGRSDRHRLLSQITFGKTLPPSDDTASDAETIVDASRPPLKPPADAIAERVATVVEQVGAAEAAIEQCELRDARVADRQAVVACTEIDVHALEATIV